MVNFSFGDIKETSAVNTSKSLKPWSIYNVVFDGIEQTTIQGKKDPDKVYNTIKMSFHCEDGQFSTNLFIPSSEDDVKRNIGTRKDGSEYEMPSHFEEFKWKLLQLVQVVNPDGYEKLKAQSAKIKTIEDFIKVVTSLANAKKGAETKLKLTGRNVNGTVYADIPRVCAINKNSECFISNNFIGNNVEFSSWEATQAKTYKEAKPTVMPNLESNLSAIESSEENNEEDIDFSSLL